jgi:cytochrome P450
MNLQEDYSEFLEITLKSKDDQYKYFDEKKQKEPIFKIKNDHWIVSRYDDINTILRSDSFLRMTDPNENDPVRSLLDLDFEDHSKYRKMLNQVFNSSLVKKLKIEQKVEENLKQIKSKETIDVVKDIAVPVPLQVIMEILGAPMPQEEEALLIKSWASNIFNSVGVHITRSGYKQYIEDMESLCTYLINVIFSDKYKKQDGLIDYLKNYYIDGKKITNQEILSICALIFVAGFETNVGSITSSIFSITQDEELLSNFQNLQIQNKTSQVSYELIRHSSSVCYAARWVGQDYVFYQDSDSPVFLSEGDFVLAHLESGNRDSTIFESPHDIILDRHNSNKHLGFGVGVHYCLGAMLARAEVAPVVDYFFKNVKNPRITGNPVRHPSYAINGFSELCVTTG